MGKNPFKNYVRTLRFFHSEMPQQELAEKAGVTRQTIIALEQEKYFPPGAGFSNCSCVWGAAGRGFFIPGR
jgi:hypothetical protein